VFLGARLGLAFLLPALVLLANPAWSLSGREFLAALGAAASLGYVAPGVWLDRRRAARQRALVNGLPDALDLLVVCVEAGLGINASLARVARETVRSHPGLSAEFELVTLETRAGKSSTEALRALAERTGVAEVSALVSMLVQTERFGTRLSDTLRVHAQGMRVRRIQRAEELAGKAPLKMLFPTLLIFVATLMVTIGPGLMQLFDFFSDASRR
jgi:tight adherence protein C